MTQVKLEADVRATYGSHVVWPHPGLGQVGLDVEEFARPTTLRDLPLWGQDAVALSMRARALLDRARPMAAVAFAYWDHVRHAITVAGRSLHIDAAGCYRLE